MWFKAGEGGLITEHRNLARVLPHTLYETHAKKESDNILQAAWMLSTMLALI